MHVTCALQAGATVLSSQRSLPPCWEQPQLPNAGYAPLWWQKQFRVVTSHLLYVSHSIHILIVNILTGSFEEQLGSQAWKCNSAGWHNGSFAGLTFSLFKTCSDHLEGHHKCTILRPQVVWCMALTGHFGVYVLHIRRWSFCQHLGRNISSPKAFLTCPTLCTISCGAVPKASISILIS